MKDSKHFDVLVVYSGNIAASAANSQALKAPFTPHSSYNQAYQYFLERCHQKGLSAAFSTTSDIVGAGQCDSYWIFEQNAWKTKLANCYSANIFDKFSDKNTALKTAGLLCFASETIKPFNSRYLKRIFTDKLKTYQLLPEFCIPTVELNKKSSETIEHSLNQLKQLIAAHPHSKDFSSTVILKDRKGAEGNLIFKIDQPTITNITTILSQHPKIQFILQPFVYFDKGFAHNNLETATDIRLIYQKGQIVQTYIRTAKKGDFRCNQHQGGSVIYTDIADIPQKVLNHSQKVIERLGRRKGLFALDYIVSNSGAVYLLEGNSNPGIIWDPGFKQDEKMAKQLIRGIVDEFVRRKGSTAIPNSSPVLAHPHTHPVYINRQAPVLLP